MVGAWVIGVHRFRHVTAATALVSAAVLAGGGVAAAAPLQHGQGRGPGADGTISTIAGGVGGPGMGTKVGLDNPCGLAVSGSNLYLSSGDSVRKLAQHAGSLTTLAGTGAIGPLGDGGPAASATVDPCGLAVDHYENVVLADTGDNLIRVVAHNSGTFYGQAMTAGAIYTVAGGGTGTNDVAATTAGLSGPVSVAVDGQGNLVIADSNFNEIQVVSEHWGTFYGQAMRPGYIYDVAGTGAEGYSGDGGPATAAELDKPAGVSLDSAGNLLIADTDNNRIRVVAAVTGLFYGQAMTAGDIYTVAGNGQGLFRGDGGPATQASLHLPGDAVVDSAGNLLIADSSNDRVRVVAAVTGLFYGQAMTAGDIYTVAGDGKGQFAGDGIPATSQGLGGPAAVAFDSAGNIVVSNTLGNRIQVVATSNGIFYNQGMTAGDIYTVAGNGSLAFSGGGGPATQAELFDPWGVTADPAGDVLISAYNNVVQAVPAATGRMYGRKLQAGHVYVVAGTGRFGYNGDGGLARQAQLGDPIGIGTDAAGDLLIPDRDNQRVRMVPNVTGTYFGQPMTAGHIYTVAGDGTAGYAGDGGPAISAELNSPRAVIMDGAGNLVVSDTANDVIRVVAAATGTFYGQAMTAGDIYTVAGDGNRGYAGDGGPAASAELNGPGGLAVDAAGNLLIADTGNDVIRVVAAATGTFFGQAMTAGGIYTVAGDGTEGFTGDGSAATSAELNQPEAVAVDGQGNLVIDDTYNNRMRVVAESTATFYGQAMTAGDIYTVAGDGTAGYEGDGGPATSAELSYPADLAVDGGNLLIADEMNGRIREVSG
jgi:hypothetical protein